MGRRQTAAQRTEGKAEEMRCEEVKKKFSQDETTLPTNRNQGTCLRYITGAAPCQEGLSEG